MSCATTANTIYTAEELSELDSNNIPRHVAIIPDGNRRWARQRSLVTRLGHENGAEVVMNTVKAAKELGVGVVTLYTFSTENWTRSAAEIRTLFRIVTNFITSKTEEMVDNGVRMQVIGQLDACPRHTQRAIARAREETTNCSDIDLVLAINYGSRDEICRTATALAQLAVEGKISPQDIDEELFASHLDTAPWGDPELLIRTSGELRVSNFMLWQLSYGELVSCQALWPDFSSKHLLQAIVEYQNRCRREGS